jgi:hypothetical protein
MRSLLVRLCDGAGSTPRRSGGSEYPNRGSHQPLFLLSNLLFYEVLDSQHLLRDTNVPLVSAVDLTRSSEDRDEEDWMSPLILLLLEERI